MDDPNQIEVPPSFTALFASPSGHRLLQPMSVVRQRYELCEDLAQMLSEQASTVMFRSGHGEREVLQQMRLALTGPGSVVEPAEAVWVVTRLAELLDWDAPPPD
ncbi:MAG TPA: ATPase with chaperone activity [Ramlibacter sp.]